ncbi:MAG: tripartite tricarboxylate transporter substrate binding protein [Betaproteobacteria bacterium]|nr:tripartite tricarboxylate transporter substrate binding protein [Betaproteobacteria bacterium]MBI2509207.1 tripartite tricarboxylate transporter substrate binding protein [Betaproteobacteria bacterium]
MGILRGVLAAGAAALPLFAAAQAWPDKPIRVIVSVPAGGTPDVTARLVTPGLSRLLGQQLVVDNRPGAGGLIGAELASKATPDGYTLFISSPGALTILPHLRKVPYDTLRDFAPVGLISIGPFVLIVHPSVPVQSVQALIALARAQPGKLNYASAGNGVANHLAMELFKQMTGVDITHVPYKGAPQAVTDVLAGHMNMMFNSVAPIIAHIKAGRVRVLGIASSRRSPRLPDVPTIAEAGVPGFEAVNWFGLFAPAKTPKRIIARLNEALVKIVRAPETRKQFEALGADPVGGSPEEFAAFIRRDTEKYAKVVKFSGAKVD